MNHIIKLLTASLLALCFTTSACAADERGTKEEARAMADAAFDHIKKVGPDKAYKDFTTDKASWSKKDLYVIVFDGRGIALAHGANEKLIGKDLSGLKDAADRPLLAGLQETANKGGGWYDYDSTDPLTKKIKGKSTYTRRLPSGDGFVGVGIYR